MNAVSAVAAEPLQRIVGDAGQVTVLSNGIDVAHWAAPADRPGRTGRRPGDGVRLVSAMRLAGRKRPEHLLHAMRRVRDLVGPAVPVHLEVLGEGPRRGRLERYVDRHDLAGVVSLPGRVAREELPRPVRRRRHLHRPRPAGVVRHRRPGGPDRRAPGRRSPRQRHRGVRAGRRQRVPRPGRRGDGARRRPGWCWTTTCAPGWRRTTASTRPGSPGSTSAPAPRPSTPGRCRWPGVR